LQLLKQAIGLLAMPMVFACVLLLVACGLWLLRRRRAAATFAVVTAVLAYFACTPFVAGSLLTPLTRGFDSPLDNPPQVKFVVVLGSWYSPRADLPVTASMNFDGLARLTEGVRLIRLLPQARLVASGGVPLLSPAEPSAHGYAQMARALGVDTNSIVVLDKARDTAEEARYLAPVVGREPFLLVTSAEHLRRAVRLMNRAGLQPIPAPATRSPGPDEGLAWRDFVPTASGLHGTEVAVHEYCGLAAIALGLD
jgi:uncharacterized SAM-binding protein YcdF (DUF218 family)